MARSDQRSAPVWLLLLDCCPFPSLEYQRSATADSTDWHPFDDLDAEALFFEQYYSRHPTADCSVTDYLGGPEVCRRFQARMQVAGKCCRHAELTGTGSGNSELPESRSGLCSSLSSDTVGDSVHEPDRWYSLPLAANLPKHSQPCCTDSDPCSTPAATQLKNPH